MQRIPTDQDSISGAAATEGPEVRMARPGKSTIFRRRAAKLAEGSDERECELKKPWKLRTY